MKLKNLIKFEPIDITHIVITFGLALIIIYAFNTQLNGFFDTLQNRPITVTMSGSETTIELDAPVKPEFLADAVSGPQGSVQDVSNWETQVYQTNSLTQITKMGFGDLYKKLAVLDGNELSVINYAVDNVNYQYFKDQTMLKYLSVASQKIRYLAFYKDNNFVGMISIKDVISGLASENRKFKNFGDKIKNGKWVNFPHLISKDVSFTKTPSVKELYNKLAETGLTEIPLLTNGELVGLLNYESISIELYTQIAKT